MPKGFDQVTTSSYRKLRLIMRVGGLEKNGKTHFALTAPGPIGVLDIDRGLEGVINKFVGDKRIYAKCFKEMASENRKDHELRWDTFEKSHRQLLADPDIRTIIWDTDTEAWEMARLAYFGKLTQVKSHHYADVNNAIRKLIDEVFDSEKNLISICRYKKQYVKKSKESDDGAWNGLYEPAGFNEFSYIAQVNIRTRLVMADGKLVLSAEIVNCRQNMSLAGEVFEGDMATFPWIAANIIDGTSPEDWE